MFSYNQKLWVKNGEAVKFTIKAGSFEEGVGGQGSGEYRKLQNPF